MGRLHRLHPLAHNPGHEPVRTRDVDFALSLRAPVAGDISEALDAAGSTRTFLGEDAPPVTHYNLNGDAGFYAEFLVPLEGSEIRRDGKRDVAVSLAGITAQKLRHLDLLLVAPWSVPVEANTGVPLQRPADILLVRGSHATASVRLSPRRCPDAPRTQANRME
jgi:hypothetical protein